MGTLAADVRFAWRMWKANPGFTAIAIAALMLGIGASTAIFTVVNAVLLQPLPYPEPDRIMRLQRGYPNGGYGTSSSIPKYMMWRQNHVFESMTLYGQGGPGAKLGSGDRPEQVKTLAVSTDFFRVFGAKTQLGRTFSADEDLPGGPKVIVISNGLWQSHFGGDVQMIGRSINLNSEPFVVIGIAQKGFRSEPEADIWMPLQADPNSTNQGHYLQVAGRLKHGVNLAAAQAELKLVGERFRAQNPKWMNANETVSVLPLQDSIVGPVKTALYILLGAVGFVLLIACANVANLLLARAAARQRELAVRTAMGANRWRVVRQLLTESVMLSGAGGLLGFALGVWGVRGLLLLAPGNIPLLTDDAGKSASLTLDWHVALVTIGVALLTGILFGLYPALQTSNPDLAATLKEASGRSGSGRGQQRARAVLVVSEIALAMVLLIGATLLIRTFVGLHSVNPGFDPHHVLTMQTSMAGHQYATTAQVSDFVTRVSQRIESLPGVEAAASAVMLPVECCIDLPFNIPGKPPAKGDTYNGDEQWRSVSPHYFQVFRIPLRRGRLFTAQDAGNSPRVVVINEHMAKEYWPKEDPIGQVIVIGKGLGPEFDDPPRQIVGIVGNVREAGLQQGEVGVMYLPQSQMPQGITSLAASVVPLSWAIRSRTDDPGLGAAVAREFLAIDSMMPVARVRTMEQVVGETVARQDFNMALLSVFAAIALLLAAIGVYGLMAYSVQQRTQEIGIRMALGAGRGDMVKMVLKQGMKLAGAGLVIGLALAFGVTRLLGSLLFGVKATDPLTFGAVVAILALVALSATMIPARRASSIEPTEALRYQ